MTQMPGPLTVRREVVVNAPIERVWRAVTEPSELNRWQTNSATLEPRVGGAIVFDYGSIVDRGTITEFAPPERFAHDAEDGTTVTWTLLREGDATRVILEITGFSEDAAGRAFVEGVSLSFTLFLGNLKTYLEEGRDERETWGRSWAGFSHATVDERSLQGSRITKVFPDSPAAAAGLRVGDLVVGVDGSPVRSRVDLNLAIVTRAPGERLVLRIARTDGDSTEVDVALTLAEPPAEAG